MAAHSGINPSKRYRTIVTDGTVQDLFIGGDGINPKVGPKGIQVFGTGNLVLIDNQDVTSDPIPVAGVTYMGLSPKSMAANTTSGMTVLVYY